MSWVPNNFDIRKHPFFATNVLEASCVAEALKATGTGLVLGSVLGASVGWWTAAPTNVVVRDSFARSGLMGAVFGSAYGAYCASAHIRHTDDWLNASIAGAVAGSIFGVKAGSIQKVVFHAAVLSVFSGLSYAGVKQQTSVKGLSFPELHERNSQGAHALPRPDPYAERIEEIRKRDAAKAE
ncbi:uncharacterized protein BJ171DRAFT_511434 [Polychytrium aggregatum]|uniref:uncharacterized protein n=1 Tax=Polychytrium aggregatum TaxID=110093 RepID=UPI0022FDCE22|nr:uncharacterized protein BJ171DRAFT_511434 [Polychytrium aggregatum]KAI9202967.1 hypothetical protein BJ171DRAFT_511434 [Polychytrium aggregatum]